MALATQTDLEHRFTADILRQWADDDGDEIVDTAVITKALADASDYVEAVLKAAYPASVPFTAGNVPNVLNSIVVRLTGYALASRRGKAAEEYKDLNDQAEAALKKLAEAGQCLVFPDGSTTYADTSSAVSVSTGAWSSMEDKTDVFTDAALTGF